MSKYAGNYADLRDEVLKALGWEDRGKTIFDENGAYVMRSNRFNPDVIQAGEWLKDYVFHKSGYFEEKYITSIKKYAVNFEEKNFIAWQGHDRVEPVAIFKAALTYLKNEKNSAKKISIREGETDESQD